MEENKCEYDKYKTRLIDLNKFSNINIYLTGYGPFQKIKKNPAQVIVEHIFQNKSNFETDKTKILYHQIFKVETKYVDENKKKVFDIVEENNK